MDLFVVQFQHESLRLNDYYNMPLIYEADTLSDINSLFSFTYYIKGKNITCGLIIVHRKEKCKEIWKINYKQICP